MLLHGYRLRPSPTYSSFQAHSLMGHFGMQAWQLSPLCRVEQWFSEYRLWLLIYIPRHGLIHFCYCHWGRKAQAMHIVAVKGRPHLVFIKKAQGVPPALWLHSPQGLLGSLVWKPQELILPGLNRKRKLGKAMSNSQNQKNSWGTCRNQLSWGCSRDRGNRNKSTGLLRGHAWSESPLNVCPVVAFCVWGLEARERRETLCLAGEGQDRTLWCVVWPRVHTLERV